MNIEIKKLTLELIKDYLYYFEHIGFTDHEEWAGCYCVYYHWSDVLQAEREEYESKGGSCFKRELAVKMIEQSSLQGYLAYIDDKVVGWCNTNDRSAYETFNQKNAPELWEDYMETEKVRSIVCYSIAPNMRRKGIATKLLEKVIEDAALEGYTYVEAYPTIYVENHQHNYHGAFSIYEKEGFVSQRKLEEIVVVRKYLQY